MNAFTEAIITVLHRDLDLVIGEISSFENDGDLWHCPDGINNPAGTLALHLAGNLQHFVGAVLGKTGYERKRDLEFSRRDADRNEIINELEEAKASIHSTLSQLDEERLEENYPLLFYDKPVTMRFILIHLAGHLNYHLGQLNYLRRLTS